MTFDAEKYLIKLKGKDYLEAKWRLVWLRDEHPDAVIETQHIDIDLEKNHAIFRATVTIPNKGSATGYGSESSRDFGDFIEKAETKALARALAALGYGTQFTGDELAEGERIVDSPVQRSAPRSQPQRARPVNDIAGAPPLTDQGMDQLTGAGGREQAAAWYFAEVQKKGLTEEERKVLQRILYGKESSKDLTERELRTLATTVRDRSVEQLRAKIAERMALDEPVAIGAN